MIIMANLEEKHRTRTIMGQTQSKIIFMGKSLVQENIQLDEYSFIHVITKTYLVVKMLTNLMRCLLKTMVS